MATHMAAEIATDAFLIGRYFGRSAAAAAARSSATPTAAAMTLMSRNIPSFTEGDGPGIRMLNTLGGSTTMMVGMSSAAGAGAGSVRFMSMFGGRRHAADPIIANEVAKYN